MATPLLPPLQDLLDERVNNTPQDSIQRRGNVDVYDSTSQGREIALCHTFVNLPFTNTDKHVWNNVGNYESIFSLALAAQHLNTGNGSVVSEVEGYHERCPLRFSIEVKDTELEERVAVDQVISATSRDISNDGLLPCFFLGAARSAVSIPTSIITGLRGYPQLSPISTSTALNDKVQHPLFGRTIPADDGTAIPFILYLRDILKVKHLAVIHINDSYGNAFGQGLQAAAQQLAPEMTVQAVDIPINPDAENIQRAVSFLKDTNYAYFFGILFPDATIDGVLEEALRQNIAGTGTHQWFFSEVTAGDIVGRSFDRHGSSLARSFRNVGSISASAGSSFNPVLQRLTTALQQVKGDVRNLDFMSSILPVHDHPNFVQLDIYDPDFLETPGLMGPFVYDAMIAAGLAACDVYLQSEDGTVDGIEHFESITQQDFAGTTGRVMLDPATGTRDANSAFFQLLNYVEDETRSTDAEIQYKEVLAGLFQNGAWSSPDQHPPFVFADGSTTPLSDVPPVEVDRNHFSPAVRAGGLFMCGSSMALGLAFAIWTKWHDRHRVVRASQPIFLYIICIGAIVLSSTIIPLSMDGGVASQEGNGIACQSVPWLLSIGFSLIFSALFTKTYRINRIFNQAGHFRRIKLTAWDVAKPMLVLLGLNVILLSISTAVAPLEWDFQVEREDSFGQPLEGYGFCSAVDAWPYLIAVGVLNFGALCFAVTQAYQARNISTEFAESDYIFRATLSIVMVCFVGVPVLVLARENSDAHFFVFSAILFLSSICILFLIFVPKIQYLRRDPNRSSAQMRRGGRFLENSGIGGSSNTSGVTATAGLTASKRTASTGLEDCLPADEDLRMSSTCKQQQQLHDHDDDADHDDEEFDDDEHGLRVITHKTQEQLVLENKALKAKLKVALEGGRGALRLSLTSPDSQESIPLLVAGGKMGSNVRMNSSDLPATQEEVAAAPKKELEKEESRFFHSEDEKETEEEVQPQPEKLLSRAEEGQDGSSSN